MRRILKSKILLVLISVLLSSCYYDEVAVFEGLPQNVSLKNDLMPIFNMNCNTTGCHDAAGAHSPSLTQENAYNALVFGQYVNKVEPSKSILYQEIVSGSMPPSGPIDINSQKIILAWITEGAKNN